MSGGLLLYTARISYRGADRLDVTRAGADPIGIAFAPSTKLLQRYHPKWGGAALTPETFAAFSREYTDEMRRSLAEQRAAWLDVLGRPSATLCCYESAGEACHRVVLAPLIVRAGEWLGMPVDYRGERVTAKAAEQGRLGL